MITIPHAPTLEPMEVNGKNNSVWIVWFTKLVSVFNSLTATGTTAQRPNPAPYVGFMFFDTTVNRPIWAKTTSQYVYADGTNA